MDDMANVTEVQKVISDMGYQANSQMEWIEQSQQTYDIIQMVLEESEPSPCLWRPSALPTP